MLDHAMNEHTAGWTEERVDLLKKLWLEGLSAGQIVSVLGGGLTRSGVIGKVHRLKLPGRKNPSIATKPRPPKRHGNAGQPKATAIVHRIVMQRELPPTPLPVEDGVDVTHLIGIMQLTDRTCRFPIGDPMTEAFGFCGDPVKPGSKYCPHHHRRAYHQI